MGILRAETRNKIDVNKISEISSLIEPLKGLVESLLSTTPVISLLIEAEIKSLFAHRYQFLKSRDVIKDIPICKFSILCSIDKYKLT